MKLRSSRDCSVDEREIKQAGLASARIDTNGPLLRDAKLNAFAL